MARYTGLFSSPSFIPLKDPSPTISRNGRPFVRMIGKSIGKMIGWLVGQNGRIWDEITAVSKINTFLGREGEMVKKRQRFLLALTRTRSLLQLLGFHFAISVTSLQRNRETIDPTCSFHPRQLCRIIMNTPPLMTKVINAEDYFRSYYRSIIVLILFERQVSILTFSFSKINLHFTIFKISYVERT